MKQTFSINLLPGALALGAVALAGMALPPVSAAQAGPSEAQGEVRKEVRAGNIQHIRDIEKRVLPTMGNAQYLGPEYDPLAMVYRLKFIKGGRVIFVDVNARSGEIIHQTH